MTDPARVVVVIVVAVVIVAVVALALYFALRAAIVGVLVKPTPPPSHPGKFEIAVERFFGAVGSALRALAIFAFLLAVAAALLFLAFKWIDAFKAIDLDAPISLRTIGVVVGEIALLWVIGSFLRDVDRIRNPTGSLLRRLKRERSRRADD